MLFSIYIIYIIPPPIDSRNTPKKMATQQIIIAPLLLPSMEKINPITAKGMLSQFSHPNNGIKPKNKPIKASIPKILPIVFIVIIDL